MDKKPLIRAGTYKHYKGGIYKVISIAKNSESHENMVIYRSLENERQLWVRPLDMFKEKVKVNGKEVQRFEFIQ